ncbi:MAG: DUF4349 domain-containing protein, partial [Elusimicrobiaceae bacterium]|nr:DUF4349 domain-containing protein [Elusimicrobiaceae bacterium]
GKMEAPQSPSAGDSTGKPRKMIYTARLEMETTEFDATVSALNTLTEQFNGYYENSTVGNRGMNYRWAEYTVRVPADQCSPFLGLR